MRRISLALVLSFLAGPAAADCGNVGIPELNLTVSASHSGVALFTPAGTAPTLAEQGLVVEVGIYDCEWNPIVGFPAEDIWLDDAGDGLVHLCQDGSHPLDDTDSSGLTLFAGAISGGGATASGTRVWAGGVPMQAPPVPVSLVSPDLDGDLAVGISDFGIFGEDFGTTAFRSDLEPDGVVDIVDFGIFGAHFGESCP